MNQNADSGSVFSLRRRRADFEANQEVRPSRILNIVHKGKRLAHGNSALQTD